jgi:hypothetical protein
MTTLDLGRSELRRPLTAPAPEPDPVARRVVVWVGVTVDVMAGKLPIQTRKMLECVRFGIPHCVGSCDVGPLHLKRINDGSRVLGYGIVVAEWETIKVRAYIPPHLSPQIANAHRALQKFSLAPKTQLSHQSL